MPRFLTDKGYRQRIIEERLTDPAVRAYWRDDFGTRARREQREMCGSVLNKVGELRRDPVMRNILGQEHDKLDIPAIIRNREILIANLAKSEVGRNQFQAQLSEAVKGALFGNVGSVITFEVGAADELSRRFDGHFTPPQLTALRQYEVALKLPRRRGNPPYPLKAYTFGLDGAGYGAARRDNIIAHSRMMFGRSRERVERSVARVLG